MPFAVNSVKVARAAMAEIEPSLADTYATLILFLSVQPEIATKTRSAGAPAVGSMAYIRRQATVFAASRVPRTPQPPATIPDEMVSFILHTHFDIAQSCLERVKKEHQLSMGAENLVGDLLERYLASVMEPQGWVWCSGSTVKSVDFVKPPEGKGKSWRLLQVKNRDNSENSSSSAIRAGTAIEKWFRTFSKKPGSNWAAFPEPELRKQLSEEGFKAFVRGYLAALPK